MKSLRKWLQYIGFALGAGILIYQIYSGVISLQQMQVHPGFSLYLLFAFLAVLAAIAVQMLAWSSAMKSLKVFLSVRDVFKGYLLSFLPRYIPGTIWGYISRSEWLMQQHGVSYRTSYQGSIVETYAAIIADIILVVNFNTLPFTVSRFPTLIFSFFLPVLIWYVLKRTARVRLHKLGFFGPTVRILFPEMDLKHWLESVAYFVAVWGLYGLGLQMVSRLLFINTANSTFIGWMNFSSVYGIAWLIGFLILFAPAGLGFRELALSNLLIGQIGISFGYSSILAVIFRLIILLSELMWLGFSFLLKKQFLLDRKISSIG